MYETENDLELMFQQARNDDQVLDEFLSEIDCSDELEVFTSNVNEKWTAVFNELIINEETLPEVIKHLIKTDELYANTHRDLLIEEYKGFYS